MEKDKHNNNWGIIMLIINIILIVSLLYIYFLPHYTLNATNQDNIDITNAMMYELNAINNVLTWGSFIIAAITIVGAVFGIAGFVQLKNNVTSAIELQKSYIADSKQDIKSFKLDVNSAIEEEKKKTENQHEETKKDIESFKQDIIDRITSIEYFNTSIEAQARYFSKSIEYLYTTSSSLLEQSNDEHLLYSLYHDYNIISLYRVETNNDKAISLQSKKEALEILKSNGYYDDLTDIEFVSNNDPNEEIRQLAREVIGAIKNRYCAPEN